MAMSQREKNALDDYITREQYPADGPDGFPVVYITKVVGAITLGNGDMHPVEAAYLAIARADEDGRFEFTIPHEDGSRGKFTITVDREFTEPAKDA